MVWALGRASKAECIERPRYFFEHGGDKTVKCMMSDPTDVLHTHYLDLPMSSSMKRFFTFHEISTLEKLLDYKTSELLEMKWFNARLLRELIVLLEDNGILERLK